jgi:hypothetical protein
MYSASKSSQHKEQDMSNTADTLLSRMIDGGVDRSRTELPEIGLTDAQWAKVTSKGLRNQPGCANTDTVARKYLAGALSAVGVCGDVFGTDSPQHHAGHNL